MDFPLGCVLRLQLPRHLLRRQPASRQPLPALLTHRITPQLTLQPVQHRRQRRRKLYRLAVLTSLLRQLLRQAAVLRFLKLRIIRFDAHQRREASRTVYRLDAALSGLDGRQPVPLPAIPRHIWPARQFHPCVAPVNQLPLPYPFAHPAAQRVVEIPPLRQDGVVLCAHIVDQPVLVIVFVLALSG